VSIDISIERDSISHFKRNIMLNEDIRGQGLGMGMIELPTSRKDF
jgi:hypothetical protein